MREIKFRGKEINTGQWVCGFYTQGLFINPNNNTTMIRHIIESDILHDVSEESIGQYTGLKDKNDKEIYEGDIVEWVFFYEKLGADMGVKECDTIVKGIIRWRQGGFILEVVENDFENAGYYSISALYTDTESDVEIIGNIYDTPELIKEEEK